MAYASHEKRGAYEIYAVFSRPALRSPRITTTHE